MKSKERIMAALAGREADRVPILEVFDPPILIDLVRRLEIDVSPGPFIGQEAYCRIAEELGIDGVASAIGMGLESIDDKRAVDRYGCVWTTGGHVDNWIEEGPIKSRDDLEGYDMVSRIRPEDFDPVRYTQERAGDNLAHFMEISDPFRISWNLRGGMQNLMMDFVLDPELVHGLARIATDFNLAVIDHAAEIGVELLIMDGDLADERTTLMSPDHFRLYIKPAHAEIVEHAHSRGIKIAKHTDGNAWPILEDFVEVGFDAFHPIQPQCMEIAEVKEKVGDRICLAGNIDCRHLLVFGTPDEVRRSVKETIDIAAPGGGYIISSSNSVHQDCKAENYLAMVEAALEYGRYE